MSNQIAIFNFENHQVRTAVHQNGEVYFCLKDVASVLDIKNHNEIVAKQLNKARVDKIYLSHESGKKLTTFINEPNLYRIIFRSNKEEAIKFQDWVFEDVLPTIRKTGEYKNKSTSTDRTPLRNACDRLAVTNMLTSDAYKIVWEQYGVNDIDQIPADKLAEATAFVYEMILRLKPTQPAPQSHLSDGDRMNLTALVCHTFNMARWYKKVSEPIRLLNRDLQVESAEAFWTAERVASGLNSQFNLGIDMNRLLAK